MKPKSIASSLGGVLLVLAFVLFLRNERHRAEVVPEPVPDAPEAAGLEAPPERASVSEGDGRLRLVLPDGLRAAGVELVGRNAQGGEFEGRVDVPGSLDLPANGPWLLLVRGDGVAPQLALEDVGGDGAVLELVPTGELRFVVSLPSDWPEAGPPVSALLVPDPEAFREGLSHVEGALLDRRLRFFGQPATPSGALGGLAEATQEDVLRWMAEWWASEDPASLSNGDRPRGVAPVPIVVDLEEDGDRLTGRVQELPAVGAHRWRLDVDRAFEVQPSQGRDGRALGPDAAVLSGTFRVPAHRVLTLEGRIQPDTSVRGRLDYGIVAGEVVGAKVVVNRARRRTAADGRSWLAERATEVVLRPDPTGAFLARGLASGTKTLEAVWWDDEGNHYVAHREFELAEGQHLDLGLVSPVPGPALGLEVVLEDADTGTVLRPDEVFTADGTAPLGRVLFMRADPKAGLDAGFGGVSYPPLGERVVVHGLGPYRWRVSWGLDHRVTEGARMAEGYRIVAARGNRVVDLRDETELRLPIRLRRETGGVVRLLLPSGTEPPDGLGLSATCLGAPPDAPPLGEVRFRTDPETMALEAPLPVDAMPCFLVLRDREPTRPGWVGAAWLRADGSGGDPAAALEVPLQRGVPVVVRTDAAHWEGGRLPTFLPVDVRGWPRFDRPHFMAIHAVELGGAEGDYFLGPVPPGVVLEERSSGSTFAVPPEGGAWDLSP